MLKGGVNPKTLPLRTLLIQGKHQIFASIDGPGKSHKSSNFHL